MHTSKSLLPSGISHYPMAGRQRMLTEKFTPYWPITDLKHKALGELCQHSIMIKNSQGCSLWSFVKTVSHLKTLILCLACVSSLTVSVLTRVILQFCIAEFSMVGFGSLLSNPELSSYWVTQCCHLWSVNIMEGQSLQPTHLL